jgi:adenylosuccinate synthase
MANVVAVGLQWGDEGKGKIVDLLGESADWAVRFAGGANAGHTLVVEGRKQVLHLLPSGVLRNSCRCGLGAGMVIDPEILLQEIEECKDLGCLETPGKIVISARAQVVLPFHKELDRQRERSKSGLGTTLRGIGPAYEDRAGRRGIWMGLLTDPEMLAERLEPGLDRANTLLSHGGGRTFDLNELVDGLAATGEKLAPFVGDVVSSVGRAVERGQNVLFEGAQGALLDLGFGTYPFVTSSSTLAGGACSGVGIGPTRIGGVVGVTKAYTTRVGSGPFPTEDDGAAGQRLREAGGEFGATTGRPRRCGWLDLPALRRAVQLNGVTSLAITKLDVLTGMEELRIAVGYRAGGEILDVMPADPAAIERVEPIYETVEGWREELDHDEGRDGLPSKAKSYLERIERELGVPVGLISVGPGREQSIVIDDPFGKKEAKVR